MAGEGRGHTVLEYKCDSMTVWRLTKPSILGNTIGYYSLVRYGLALLVSQRAESRQLRLRVSFSDQMLECNMTTALCYENPNCEESGAQGSLLQTPLIIAGIWH